MITIPLTAILLLFSPAYSPTGNLFKEVYSNTFYSFLDCSLPIEFLAVTFLPIRFLLIPIIFASTTSEVVRMQ